ncbi:MAG: WxcM-like domain-containing protein [Candidatus Omnitrophica bacterium]|nr:WxcM-like domain-containing protein [Candidatus Omnitrophota bacterium]
MPRGLIYAFQSKPGAVRGRHYHKRKSEWFCVLRGKIRVTLKDTTTGEISEHELNGQTATYKLFVPPGFTHTFTTIGPEDSIVVAYVNETFDPKDPDTFPDTI